MCHLHLLVPPGGVGRQLLFQLGILRLQLTHARVTAQTKGVSALLDRQPPTRGGWWKGSRGGAALRGEDRVQAGVCTTTKDSKHRRGRRGRDLIFPGWLGSSASSCLLAKGMSAWPEMLHTASHGVKHTAGAKQRGVVGVPGGGVARQGLAMWEHGHNCGSLLRRGDLAAWGGSGGRLGVPLRCLGNLLLLLLLSDVVGGEPELVPELILPALRAPGTCKFWSVLLWPVHLHPTR